MTPPQRLYQLTMTVSFPAIDDPGARRLGRSILLFCRYMGISAIHACRFKLQETYDDKPPRRIPLEIFDADPS